MHIPYCLSPCFYCGCARIITHDRSKASAYLARLQREIGIVARHFDCDRSLAQLHFGGGAPNFLDVEQLLDLIGSIGRNFSFSTARDREFGIELDPRFCDENYARRITEAGINRVSIGVQDFDPTVQETVNRVQSVDDPAAPSVRYRTRIVGYGAFQP